MDEENDSYKKLITHYQKASPYCFPQIIQMLLAWKDLKSPAIECSDAKILEKREVRISFTIHKNTGCLFKIVNF